MKKLLWSFGLISIIIVLGGCSSFSKTSGSSKAKAIGYQMVQKNGILSDRKGITEKDDLKNIENITADIKWDKAASVNKGKEDAVFWFIDLKNNKEVQKYKVGFNENGSANVQDEKQVQGVLEPISICV